ncbi:MAG TPA: YhdP family protein [Gammaproteobacteria bacterium]
MWQLARKLAKSLYIGAGIVAIVLAIGIGAFRLVVTQLPSYRGEIETWARDALGLAISFERVDARWALQGPELTFHEASVGMPGAGNEPLITAREASIGISIPTLLAERRIAVSRLTVIDTEFTVERAEDGSFRLQGAPSGEPASANFDIDDLPPVEVQVRDSTVFFEDSVSGLSWEFLDVTVALARDDERVTLEARADPPAEFASRIDLSADGSLPESPSDARLEWRIVAELRDLDLSALTAMFPQDTGILRSGIGDVSVWFDIRDGRVRQATSQIALENVLLAEHEDFEDDELLYETVSVTTEWSRADDGWELALSDLNLRRGGRSWPEDVVTNLTVSDGDDGVTGVVLASSFLRLEDVSPLIAALPPNPLQEPWREFLPRGDFLDLELDWAELETDWSYSAAADFRDVGVNSVDGLPGIEGLSGELRADSRSGRMTLLTRDAVFDWPGMFLQPLDIGELITTLVWRQGVDGIRLVSDSLMINNDDIQTQSHFELTIPPDGSSPTLDLESYFYDFDTTRTSHYLPVGALPAPVIAWLDRSIVRGYVPRAHAIFAGPVRAFPFYNDEGLFEASFDVENGVLAFMPDWAPARNVRATVDFLNEGFVANGTASVLGEDRAVISGGIADMRNGVVHVDGVTDAELTDIIDYLNEVPLFAQRLGPDLTRVQAAGGFAEVDLTLDLPLRDIAGFDLSAQVSIRDGELRVDGFGLAATDIQGVIELDNLTVTGSNIEATLLDGPVVARVSPPEEEGYRSRLDVEGEIAAEAVSAAFDLPLDEYLAGQTRWQGSLLLPSNPEPGSPAQRAPLRVNVASNLSGVALKFPEPLAKLPAEATSFQLQFVVPQRERLDIEGNLGAANRFVLSLANRPEGLALRRGAVRFGGANPELPESDGLDIRGTLGQVGLDDWLRVFADVASDTPADALVSNVDLEIMDFSAFGQRLGTTTLAIERRPTSWLVDIGSEPVAGQMIMPLDLGSRGQIRATMSRLHLAAGDPGESRDIDPRDLPGLFVTAEDFVVGQRRYGELEADIRAESAGLSLASFETANDGFTLSGSGDWSMGTNDDSTRLVLTLASADVALALDELGLFPVLEGELAEVTANVHWPGGPSADWRRAISGDLAVRLEQGSVLDIEPGAGRMMGLLSFTALPRRLSLDFRDVFNRGLVFDEVSGNFVLIDGNAYTDNLLLTGPVADIGLVGRTGLKDRTYQQQAVVTSEATNVLPTMGFLAGPGVGTALLIFTQIFREPLKGIGRASYCMSGTWDEPSIERLTPADLESGELCADLPPGGLSAAQE